MFEFKERRRGEQSQRSGEEGGVKAGRHCNFSEEGMQFLKEERAAVILDSLGCADTFCCSN